MNRDALTADEVADILQIGRNRVYELAKEGVISSYKIGRKLRFTYSDVQAYIASSHQPTRQGSKSVPTPAAAQERSKEEQFVLCGQNVMLDVLANYLNQEDVPAVRSYADCFDSLLLLYKGQVHAADAHIWDGDSGEYNIPTIKRLLPGVPVVVVRLMSRMEGLIVAKGNPKGVTSWEDLARSDVVLINQKRGADTRILLDEHLRVLGIDPQTVQGYDSEPLSRITSAAAIAHGKADVTVSSEKIARQVDGVEFIPLHEGHVDLVLHRERFESSYGQKMMDILESDILREDFEGVNGYDVSDTGRIVWMSY